MDNEDVACEKTLEEKAVNFLCNHPVIGAIAYTAASLLVAIPLTALFGIVIGRNAGKEAGKMLAEAGVKLGYNHD